MPRPYGRLVDAVLWTSRLIDEGAPVVDVDPQRLVDEINAKGMPLLFNHDPGAPRGMVLSARLFTSPTGIKFVAGMIGLYAQGDCLSFEDLGLGDLPPVESPSRLKPLPPDTSLLIAADPREVDDAWIADVIAKSPLPVERTELSHNASEATAELVRVALPYVLLVWNPFVTEIAKAAGKDVYTGVRDWLRQVITKLSERRNPILAIEAGQDGCQVAFLLRGNDTRKHYAAHAKLSEAAAQAARLITHMKEGSLTPRKVVYEFDPAAERWAPSYAILADGRLVSRQATLIAIEQAPAGLSLGLVRNRPEQVD